jgi:hypothetical protein
MAMQSARDYVMRLDLPDSPPGFESAPEPDFTTSQQALTVGSQLTEFTPKVSSDARSAISNSLLLAQLAANKAANQTTDVFAWYGKYNEVLRGIGWLSRNLDFQGQANTTQDLDVHRAIIPVIMTALGPAAAAVSIVLSVLNGLKDMNADSPWITLFNRQSEHASGAKFQMTYVDSDANGQPQLTLVCFAVKAQKTLTQVLFFKFQSQHVELKQATDSLVVTLDRLNADRAAIAGRVDSFVTSNIQSIDI